MKAEGEPAADFVARSDLGEDTSPAARELQRELYRRMTPGERLALVFELNELAETCARAGLRRRHPDADEREITLLLAELEYGPEIAAKLRCGER